MWYSYINETTTFGLDVFLSIHFVVISCVSKAIKIVDEFILLGVWISEKFLKFLIFIWISREYWRKILAAKDFAELNGGVTMAQTGQKIKRKKKKRKEAFCCTPCRREKEKKDGGRNAVSWNIQGYAYKPLLEFSIASFALLWPEQAGQRRATCTEKFKRDLRD